MDFSFLKDIFHNQFVRYVFAAFAGALVLYLRNRVRRLEYVVHHERIASSSIDPIFGSIQATWQGNPVSNLYASRVELTNDTSRDFSEVVFKVYSGDTILLTERTEVIGTPRIVEWSPAFKQLMFVQPGGTPTQQQYDIYNKSREYKLPVFNRGQKIAMTYLTAIPLSASGPGVWIDVAHKGIKVEYIPPGPRIHGVPQKAAIGFGLAIGAVTFVIFGVYSPDPWLTAFVCMFVGLFAQSIGAVVYRALKLLRAIVLH